MKFDELGCLIRQKYPDGHIANLGDSCAETARASILGDLRAHSLWRFRVWIGYVRHPSLANVSGWDHTDFSNDQFLPLIMAKAAFGYTQSPSVLIPGTNTIVSAGVLCIMLRQYWLLNVVNIIQGWLFNLKWRVADDGNLERQDGQVQDWLNYLCTYVFLRRIGKWATLNQPKERCMKAVRKYYLEGDDFEPNSQWIVDLYSKALASDSEQTSGSNGSKI